MFQHSFIAAYCILLRANPGLSRLRVTGDWPIFSISSLTFVRTSCLVHGAGTNSTSGTKYGGFICHVQMKNNHWAYWNWAACRDVLFSSHMQIMVDTQKSESHFYFHDLVFVRFTSKAYVLRIFNLFIKIIKRTLLSTRSNLKNSHKDIVILWFNFIILLEEIAFKIL